MGGLFPKLALVAMGVFMALAMVELGLRLWPDLSRQRASADPQDFVGKNRVLAFVGDSVTYGSGVNRADSFPSRVAARVHEVGLRELAVVDFSEQGAQTPYLLTQLPSLLAQAPYNHQLDIVLLFGVNDFVEWRWRNNPFGGGTPDLEAELPELRERPRLRIMQVLGWGWGAARGEVGQLAIDPRKVEGYRRAVTLLALEAQRHGGQLLLATYLVPGRAPDSLEGDQAAIVDASSMQLREINELIRTLAGQQGLKLVDLERQVPMPSTWSRDDFVDHIHLTPRSHALAARAIMADLEANGVLPSGVLP